MRARKNPGRILIRPFSSLGSSTLGSSKGRSDGESSRQQRGRQRHGEAQALVAGVTLSEVTHSPHHHLPHRLLPTAYPAPSSPLSRLPIAGACWTSASGLPHPSPHIRPHPTPPHPEPRQRVTPSVTRLVLCGQLWTLFRPPKGDSRTAKQSSDQGATAPVWGDPRFWEGGKDGG